MDRLPASRFLPASRNNFNTGIGSVKGTWLEATRGIGWRFGMTKRSAFEYRGTSPEIIRLAVMMFIRFTL